MGICNLYFFKDIHCEIRGLRCDVLGIDVEDAFHVGIGSASHFFFAYAVTLGNLFQHFRHKSALVPFASVRYGSHVWAVGFENNAI